MSSKLSNGNDWGCCGANLDSNDLMKCITCGKNYHMDCISTSSGTENIEVSTWECPLCISQRPKNGSNDENQPVRFNPNVTTRAPKRQALQSPPESPPASESVSASASASTVSASEIRSIMQEYCMNVSSRIDSLSSSLRSELKSVKDEISDMKCSMDFMNSKYELLLQEHKETKEAMVVLQNENSALKTNVQNLNSRLNSLEQSARAMNVEIQCVPERKNENILQVVTQLGSIINCNVKSEDIISCTRIAKINKSSARPKSIVAQFSNKKIRDEFLAASINFNRKKAMHDKLNTSHLGFNGEKTPIFIVDHLSPMNKSLHAAARKIGKEKGYKHVWVRNGRIFMRKTDDSDYVLIRDMDSLSKIK